MSLSLGKKKLKYHSKDELEPVIKQQRQAMNLGEDYFFTF